MIPSPARCIVNLQDQNIFAVSDPVTDKVVGRYSVGQCKGNDGMALDPEHHRAFLACEENNPMTVFDLDKHTPIAFLPLAGGPDVIKFDAGFGRIYVACYSATSVFHQDDSDHYHKLEDFRVQHAVYSLAIDSKTHRVYTPEQEEDGKPVARMVVYEAVAVPLSLGGDSLLPKLKNCTSLHPLRTRHSGFEGNGESGCCDEHDGAQGCEDCHAVPASRSGARPSGPQPQQPR
jgi:hypothetical protein